MNGKLEPTNSPYAMAKLSAIEIGRSMSKQYGHKVLNLMPTNLYGPNDYFSDLDSHVIPALIHRMYKTIKNDEDKFIVWGSGAPLREFLYVDDLSNFINFIIDKDIKNDLINVGSGEEISIKNLALLIQELMDFEGDVIFDSSKPDGNPRKLLDSGLMKELGWKEFTDLRNGLKNTINWYKSNQSQKELIKLGFSHVGLIRPLSNNIFSLVAISMSLSTISFIRSSKLVEDSQFNKLFALEWISK